MSELTAAYIDAVYKSKAVPNDKLDKAVASLRQGVKNIKADLFKKPSHSS
jgi:hypothetical protein